MARRRAIAISLLIAFGLLACSRDTITRTQWQQMSPGDKVLYVKSLVGAEKAKDAKGGTGRSYDQPAEEYAQRIDAAYGAGDDRLVHEIFETLEPHR